MRALWFDGSSASLDRAAPEPQPPPGAAGLWALIRPTRAAISEQDLDVARGGTGFVGPLGREWVGVVEALMAPDGAVVTGAEHKRWVGKRVVGGAMIACGACDLCRGGLPNHCRDGRVMGLRGVGGCLAERFVAPLQNLVEVPRDVDDDGAVFADVLARALHGAQQARVDARSTPTVIGDGALALLVAQALWPVCERVRVVGWREAALALCERWGVKHRPAGDAGLRGDQTSLVECSGTGEGLKLAAAMARPRARLVLAAPLRERDEAGAARVLEALRMAQDRELEVVGSRGGSVPEAVSMLQRGGVDVVSLITRRVKFGDAPEALRAAGRADQIRVLIEM